MAAVVYSDKLTVALDDNNEGLITEVTQYAGEWGDITLKIGKHHYRHTEFPVSVRDMEDIINVLQGAVDEIKKRRKK